MRCTRIPSSTDCTGLSISEIGLGVRCRTLLLMIGFGICRSARPLKLSAIAKLD
jgi:hypothetical protein